MLAVFQEWLRLNNHVITFAYGQVFFTIGLAILSQTRRYSRLDIADSLPWLAAFGFFHGFHEWGGVFIPFQRRFFADSVITGFLVLQLILLAGSFACLFVFAGNILKMRRRFRLVPLGVFFIWAIISIGVAIFAGRNSEQWRDSSEVFARYLIGLPGGMLSVLALLRYARTNISSLDSPRVSRAFLLAGIFLAAYAAFAGLLGPEAPFFPSSIINSEIFSKLFVFPPLFFRSIFAALFAIHIFHALGLLEIETGRLLKIMEREAVAVVERKRAARDLHDNTFQRLYAAGLLAQALKREFLDNRTAASELNKLMRIINEVISELQTFLLGLVTTEGMTDLSIAITRVAEEARSLSGIDVRLKAAENPTFSPTRASHIVAFTRESLSNVARHAHARSVEVTLECEDNMLHLTIEDDGQGLPADLEKGYGMRDMLDRARLLGGEVSFHSENGDGTTIALVVPLKDDE
ncbi:MAG: hypothetical protein CMN78_03770 [Spirochaetales bacterium]|nr:hypothetical protein [Spirochaetales bacterium]